MLDIKWELILYTFRDNPSKSCVIEPPSYLYVTEILFLRLYPLFNKKYGVLEYFPCKGVSRFLERGIFFFRSGGGLYIFQVCGSKLVSLRVAAMLACDALLVLKCTKSTLCNTTYIL